MTDREKLVELAKPVLTSLPFPWCTVWRDVAERIADAWLANGVTFAKGINVPGKWIPASKPPEEYRDEYGELIPFLVCVDETEYPFRAMYDGKKWGDGLFEIPVKWWMPLPAPPKEDE